MTCSIEVTYCSTYVILCDLYSVIIYKNIKKEPIEHFSMTSFSICVLLLEFLTGEANNVVYHDKFHNPILTFFLIKGVKSN